MWVLSFINVMFIMADAATPPDEFERELDAMLAEVQCGNNIPFSTSVYLFLYMHMKVHDFLNSMN